MVQHLTTFVRIAEAGNISRAARSLRLSVPMASRHLRALEQEFGVALLRRTTRHAELTEAGVELLTRARRLLAALDEARDALRPGAQAAGVLTISAPVSFGLAQVAPLVPTLLARHPKLSLDVRFEDRVVDLVGDGVDLALRVGVTPPDSPFVVARRLATYERVLCASPQFLKRSGGVSGIEALERTPCICLGTSPARWQFETPAGPRSLLVHGRMRTNNILAIREAALAGVGVAQLPIWLIRGDLRAKRLTVLLADVKLPVVSVLGLTHVDARRSNALRLVQDALAEALPRSLGAPPPRRRSSAAS